ncbi:MAG: efflux RND transporter periplasmic adaptor subunit [Paludibacter sp.]|nr:efflux RND transporter periplasmic adaptor subunit [Paludibacter sp.]
MKTPTFISNKYFKNGLMIFAGLFLGWLFFHSSGTDVKSDKTAVHEHSEDENTTWTCSMHPQIRMDKPGDCPICGMDLIPLKKTNAEIDSAAIEMSESAMKLAEVQTSKVSYGGVSKDVSLYGKIQPNEKLLQSQTAHVPGRIEKLYINVTGETVKSGQLIASIYSPELITAQKELLEAVSMGDKYPAILESAREKLRNWKLSEAQIQTLESSGKVNNTFKIYANTSGIVSNLKVNEGDYINKGVVLFDVVNLSNVWAVFDAYESDLPWVSLGQKVDFTTQAIPGKTFSGKVSFIDPVIDPATRTAKVRVEIANQGMQLKPEFFVNGTIQSGKKSSGNQLIIPQSAVLWTGVRSIVYVRIPDATHPTFKMREITLGASMKNTYVVQNGLMEGEEIVTNGTFSVDAAAQLEGKPSMMNREKNQKPVTSMPGMKM